MSIYIVRSPEQNKRGVHRTDAPSTSVQAAEMIMPKTGTQRAKVLDAYARHPMGLTDSELSEITGLVGDSYRPRRRELVVSGWVADTGRTRSNAHGNDQIIFAITPEGRRKWYER